MSRIDRSAALCAATFAAALLNLPATAQKPSEPLGDLLDVIPLPEGQPPAEESPPPRKPIPAPPAPAPSVRPGNVLSVDLPPSAATGAISVPDEPLPDADPVAGRQAVAEADDAAADAAEADAAWAALQEQRRAAVNAVESPIVDRLNAEMAARAEAEGRRFAAEQEAYERSLIEHDELVRRREAEHAAEMEAHARRVAREQAEYRARVEACLAGDRRACE